MSVELLDFGPWKPLFPLLNPDDSPESCMLRLLEGSLKRGDAIALRFLLQSLRPRRILEVGSFLGVSSNYICKITQPWGAHVTCVDPGLHIYMFEDPHAYFRVVNAEYLDGGRMSLIPRFFSLVPPKIMDSIDVLYWSVPVLDSLLWEPDGLYDFIFIDGDHSDASVRANFRDALQILNPSGGVLVFHDVSLCNDELAIVHRAFNAEAKTLGPEYGYFITQGENNLGCVYRK